MPGQQAAIPVMGIDVIGSVLALDRTKYGQRQRVSGVTPQPPDSVLPLNAGTQIGILELPQVTKLGIHHVTVQLDRTRVEHSSNADVRARIEWGVGGAYDSLECDWADGGLVQIVADQVRVIAVPYQPDDRTPYDTTGFDSFLSAAVGVGGGVNVPPQFTTQTRLIAAGGSTSYPVPAYTRAVSILGSFPGDPLLDIYQHLTLQLVRVPATVFATFDGGTLVGGAAVPASNSVVAAVTVSAGAPGACLVGCVFHLGA